ncbi:MAG: CRISPR-associated endoribonuclease Cas6 [Actinobacteria bacterium]|nr:CRISPR-associated endoribonuclease Cas6 [Actinomycetota bacterium]
MSEKLKTYKLELKPLTPIIIGSGEELEAYEYVIHRDGDGNDYLYAINWLEYINTVPIFDRAKILSLIESGNIMQLRQFLENKAESIVSKENCLKFKLNASKPAADKIRSKIKDPQNALAVKLFIRSFGKPYIPGSSLKGALRTASLMARISFDERLFDEFKLNLSILKKKLHELQNKLPKKQFDKIKKKEEEIFIKKVEDNAFDKSSPFNDPFRSLKVGDSSFAQNYIIDVQRKELIQGKWSDHVSELREATLPEGNNPIAIPITLDSSGANHGEVRSFIRALTREEVVNSCRYFYGRVYLEETKFYGNNYQNKPTIDWSWAGQLKDAISDTKDDGWFPVRLGWGTGKTGMTIGVVLGKEKAPITRRLVKKNCTVIHGLILRLARDKDKDLSREWHDGKELKGFSVSPLCGRCAHTNNGQTVVKDQQYWFKIGLFGKQNFDAVGDSLFPMAAENKSLKIGGLDFQIKSIDMEGNHLTALSSWSELINQNNTEKEIALKFFTPTTFRRKQYNRIIPDAELVFGSLQNRWNELCETKLPNIRQALLEEVVISYVNIKSAIYPLKTQPLIGFRGICAYEVKSKSAELASHLNRLANLAIFSGIGQKTTMGMGVAKVIERE